MSQQTRSQTHAPGTDSRVPRHTAGAVNARITEQARERVRKYAGADRAEITARIAQLKREWDIERTLEANAASVALIGLGLGAFVNRRFFMLPALVAGFLLQHAVQGWCPPLPVFRRLGVRTASEIHDELIALRILRGDFEKTSDPDQAFDQAAISASG
jgi:hypothetical protein